MVLSTLPGARNWLEKRLGAWGGQKNEPGRRAVGTGRPETRQFVSLAQKLYRHGFGKPRGVGPCFRKIAGREPAVRSVFWWQQHSGVQID